MIQENNGFWAIDAYTNGYQIVILGSPPELPDDHPLTHSCDAMGCGSLDHVVARIPIMAPHPELDWVHGYKEPVPIEDMEGSELRRSTGLENQAIVTDKGSNPLPSASKL